MKHDALIIEDALKTIRTAVAQGLLSWKQIVADHSDIHLRELLSAAGVIAWRTAADKRCIFLNEVWPRTTGHKVEEDLDFGWAVRIHPEDLPKVTLVLDEAFERRVPFCLTYRLRCADSGYVWICGQGAPLFSPKGEFEGYGGVAFEIVFASAAA